MNKFRHYCPCGAPITSNVNENKEFPQEITYSCKDCGETKTSMVGIMSDIHTTIMKSPIIHNGKLEAGPGGVLYLTDEESYKVITPPYVIVHRFKILQEA